MKSVFYNIVNPQFSFCEFTGGGHRCQRKLVSPRHRSNKYTISRVVMISNTNFFKYFFPCRTNQYIQTNIVFCSIVTKNDFKQKLHSKVRRSIC
jgi:hypothetical protein